MSQEPEDLTELASPSGPRPPMATMVLGALLAVSMITNAVLLSRGPQRAPADATRVIPATTPCPSCPVCAACAECPPPPPPPEPCPEARRGDGGVRTGGGTPTPRVNEAMAREGEGHIATATEAGERDPVQLRAQRSVIDGVDRITTSRSPAAAERFLQRNLPAIASMDCAFRDPALAEHVRMRMREMNALARPQARLTEEQLTRYERDLRCPRE